MTPKRWGTLHWIATHWRWAWIHLVSARDRLEWARIAMAMSSRSLHAPDWSDDRVTVPAWVPCLPCGDMPCHRDQDEAGDRAAERLERILTP